MRLFGLNLGITREKALSSVPSAGSGGWWPVVREGFSGAWQRNITVERGEITAHHAVFAAVSLVASDISKLRVRVVRQDEDSGVWAEVASPAYSPVLRKPNAFQTRIQLFEAWMLSKLLRGNAYVL